MTVFESRRACVEKQNAESEIWDSTCNMGPLLESSWGCCGSWSGPHASWPTKTFPTNHSVTGQIMSLTAALYTDTRKSESIPAIAFKWVEVIYSNSLLFSTINSFTCFFFAFWNGKAPKWLSNHRQSIFIWSSNSPASWNIQRELPAFNHWWGAAGFKAWLDSRDSKN